MELSSPRFKALAVTAGFSFWFFVITATTNNFSLEFFALFVAPTLIVTQIFALKLSRVLDAFAIFNTKFFLGILFILVFSIYGLVFRMLHADLLRLKQQKESYWLEMEILDESRVLKQY